VADLEAVNEAPDDTLISFAVNRVGIGWGVEEGGVGGRAGMGGDIVITAEAADVARHIIGNTARGIYCDVLAEVGGA
jgi:hypothetical protein